MIDTQLRPRVQPLFDALVTPLAKRGIHPVRVTRAALVVGVFAACLIPLGGIWPPVLLLWISGLFDVLDGSLARKMGTGTKRGAFLDIVGDRIVEACVILGLGVRQPDAVFPLLVLLAAILISMTLFLVSGSLLPNDSRKAFRYQAGVAERTEGFLLFSLMILYPEWSAPVAWIFAGLVAFTAGQRFRETWHHLEEEEGA